MDTQSALAPPPATLPAPPPADPAPPPVTISEIQPDPPDDAAAAVRAGTVHGVHSPHAPSDYLSDDALLGFNPVSAYSSPLKGGRPDATADIARALQLLNELVKLQREEGPALLLQLTRQGLTIDQALRRMGFGIGDSNNPAKSSPSLREPALEPVLPAWHLNQAASSLRCDADIVGNVANPSAPAPMPRMSPPLRVPTRSAPASVASASADGSFHKIKNRFDAWRHKRHNDARQLPYRPAEHGHVHDRVPRGNTHAGMPTPELPPVAHSASEPSLHPVSNQHDLLAAHPSPGTNSMSMQHDTQRLMISMFRAFASSSIRPESVPKFDPTQNGLTGYGKYRTEMHDFMMVHRELLENDLCQSFNILMISMKNEHATRFLVTHQEEIVRYCPEAEHLLKSVRSGTSMQDLKHMWIRRRHPMPVVPAATYSTPPFALSAGDGGIIAGHDRMQDMSRLAYGSRVHDASVAATSLLPPYMVSTIAERHRAEMHNAPEDGTYPLIIAFLIVADQHVATATVTELQIWSEHMHMGVKTLLHVDVSEKESPSQFMFRVLDTEETFKKYAPVPFHQVYNQKSALQVFIQGLPAPYRDHAARKLKSIGVAQTTMAQQLQAAAAAAQAAYEFDMSPLNGSLYTAARSQRISHDSTRARSPAREGADTQLLRQSSGRRSADTGQHAYDRWTTAPYRPDRAAQQLDPAAAAAMPIAAAAAPIQTATMPSSQPSSSAAQPPPPPSRPQPEYPNTMHPRKQGSGVLKQPTDHAGREQHNRPPGRSQPSQPCWICKQSSHFADSCPRLVEVQALWSRTLQPSRPAQPTAQPPAQHAHTVTVAHASRSVDFEEPEGSEFDPIDWPGGTVHASCSCICLDSISMVSAHGSVMPTAHACLPDETIHVPDDVLPAGGVIALEAFAKNAKKQYPASFAPTRGESASRIVESSAPIAPSPRSAVGVEPSTPTFDLGSDPAAIKPTNEAVFASKNASSVRAASPSSEGRSSAAPAQVRASRTALEGAEGSPPTPRPVSFTVIRHSDTMPPADPHAFAADTTEIGIPEYLSSLPNKLRYFGNPSDQPELCVGVIVNGVKVTSVPILVDGGSSCMIVDYDTAKHYGMEIHATATRLHTSNGMGTAVVGITRPYAVEYGSGPAALRTTHCFLVVKGMGPVFGFLFGDADAQAYGGITDAGMNTFSLRPQWSERGTSSHVLTFPTCCRAPMHR